MKKIIAVLMVLSLAGCVAGPGGRVQPDPYVFGKSSIVPLGTGLVGALICNQLFEGHGSRDGWTAACGIGGYFLGRSFTRESNTVLERNPIGQASTWRNPDGQTMTMTPTRTYYEGSTPCREYRTTVEIDGQSEILTGTACRLPDGTWRATS
ncbi:MAG: hypothetical protein OEU36_04585 [Gammaproteobacteria bacterium]|nr:hypothetical protein [Gammaproteobacteria bacterium]